MLVYKTVSFHRVEALWLEIKELEDSLHKWKCEKSASDFTIGNP